LRQRHEECLIHTGQHYDEAMSGGFFQELSLPTPDYHLDCRSGTHGAQTARILESVEQVLMKEQPDWVVVFGDTNTTLAGALAAVKLHIPLAHVEAGLRSFNREMPEEINRIITDHISDRLFCPTDTAFRHLKQEGITRGVEVVGDVMYDLQLQIEPILEERKHALFSVLGLEPRQYLLVTVHRPFNTDDIKAMRNIAEALNKLDVPVIFPLHPRTRKRLSDYDITWREHIRLVEPVGYLDMLTLERYAYRILTDSGGVQKQAFFFAVPCITLREETEWSETVESGWNVLVGSQCQAILAAVHLPMPPPARTNPFGDGQAATRIVQSLLS
jgi:UDP-N-acetylglucosamine 2-epimerase